MKTLVLGVGNYLLSDDGVGVHAIQRLLEQNCLPEEVQVIDGGTLGLDLLYLLEGVDRLILVDAVKTSFPPGTLVRLDNEQVPAYLSLKVSPHEIGVPELLMAAQLRDIAPPEIIVMGIQPESLETGVDLSPCVAASLEQLVKQVTTEAMRGLN